MPKFHVVKSIEIDAPSQKVFDTVADFDSWTCWSPWLIAEPDAEVIVSDDSNSVGSLYSWNGEVVGQGEIEHLILDRPQKIVEEIRFLKPFKSTSQVEFDLQEDSGKTKLSWHMRGSLPWFLFWMVPQMKFFIGMDYERGLRMLKEWIETGKVQSHVSIPGTQQVGPIRMVGVHKVAPISQIGPSMDEAFAKARSILEQNGVSTDGTMMSVYHKMDTKSESFEYTSGYEIGMDTPVPQGLREWSLPAAQAFRVDHVGPYEHLGNGWSVANQHVRYKKLKQSKAGTFEIYRTKPESTDDVDYLTEIYLPLR